jgi:hypothetical protein
LAVFIDQIRPPIKYQKGEKLANLVTYSFTINQVPHVFGDYYFAGHKLKYMWFSPKGAFQTPIHAKETRKTSTKSKAKLGEAPRSTDP